jgi:hypothetical protein
VQEQDRKLAWSSLFVLAVVAAEIAWFLFVGPTHYNPSNAADQKAYDGIWESLSSAAFWTALFTGALTASTIFLWWTTRATLTHAQESTERQLRPYVAIKITNCSKLMSPTEVVAVDLTTVWENVGVTPGLKVTVAANSIPLQGVPAPDFDYPNYDFDALAFTSIGAHQTLSSKPVRLDLAGNKGKRFFYWTWIEYESSDPNSNERFRSEMCSEIFFNGDPALPETPLAIIHFGPFNGMDRTCFRKAIKT